MERLTKRNPDGIAAIDFNALGQPFGKDTVYDVVDLYYMTCAGLAAYEDACELVDTTLDEIPNLKIHADCMGAKVSAFEAEITRLTRDNATLRNELCLKCGRYKLAHDGACDGCRWHKKGED